MDEKDRSGSCKMTRHWTVDMFLGEMTEGRKAEGQALWEDWTLDTWTGPKGPVGGGMGGSRRRAGHWTGTGAMFAKRRRAGADPSVVKFLRDQGEVVKMRKARVGHLGGLDSGQWTMDRFLGD